MPMRKLMAALGAAGVLALAGAAQAKETRLIFATLDPPTIELNTLLLHPWAARVNKEGKDIIHIDVRDGSAIANHSNFYDRVVDDVVQLAFGQVNFIAGKFPRSGIMNLPFIADNTEAASIAFWRLYKTGLLGAEYKGIRPIMFASLPQDGLHLRKKPRTLDNLDGLRIAAGAKAMAMAIGDLGAAPQGMVATEYYQALQHGTVDGCAMIWQGLRTFKLDEVTTYHVETQLGSSLAMLFMTQKRYDALSPAARRVLDANTGLAESRRAGIYYEETRKTARDKVMAEGGHTIVTLTPQQAASWRKRIEPVTQDWAHRTPNGEKILAKFRELLAEVKTGK